VKEHLHGEKNQLQAIKECLKDFAFAFHDKVTTLMARSQMSS